MILYLISSGQVNNNCRTHRTFFSFSFKIVMNWWRAKYNQNCEALYCYSTTVEAVELPLYIDEECWRMRVWGERNACAKLSEAVEKISCKVQIFSSEVKTVSRKIRFVLPLFCLRVVVQNPIKGLLFGAGVIYKAWILPSNWIKQENWELNITNTHGKVVAFESK